MIEALVLNTAQNFDSWAQMATQAASGAQKFVRPAYHSPAPKLINEVERRIKQLESQTAKIEEKNKVIAAHSAKIMSGTEYTPEQAAAHIDEIANAELMLRGLSGAVSNYKDKSVSDDHQLGRFRRPLMNAYDQYTAELEAGVGLAVQLLGYLRQFLPPTEIVNSELELTHEVMDGFLEASQALLQDAANGKDIEFV